MLSEHSYDGSKKKYEIKRSPKQKVQRFFKEFGSFIADIFVPILGVLGLGTVGCAGCLSVIFLSIFVRLVIAYAVYWVCLNWFGFPYPWPEVLGLVTFLGSMIGSSSSSSSSSGA